MSTVVSYPSEVSGDQRLAEIHRVFARQREAAIRLRTSTCAERLAKLKKLKQAVLDHTPEWYAAGAADFRKPQAEIDVTEILPVVAEVNDAVRHLARWMKPRRVWPSRALVGTQGDLQYEPKGRCLIISPWNYPVNLTFGPLVSAIAAGNTAMLKPSEMTPNLARVMSKLVREVFAEDEVALFEGDAGVAQALLALPFDHIFFTGSPAIGKVVMAAAAKHLTSVTLELGGKSPTIIDADAKLAEAARNLMWSKFTNDGQTCIAPDHIYVHASVMDAFVQHCCEALEKSYGSDPAQQKTCPDLARVVNQRHTVRIKALLDDAKSRGARALTGDVVAEEECYVAPTLLDNVPDDAKIMREEIFGPLLPIIPFDDIDAVIRRINADPKPLALYIWSHNESNIRKVMKQTTSGGACINHSVVQFLHGNLPFGGVNNSGIGSGHGLFGFKAFSHERAVVRNRFSISTLFAPPYTPRLRRLVRFLMKIV